MRISRFMLASAVLSILAAIAQQIGWLAPAERWAYDVRARHCQFFTPQPSDQIVHVDIDDGSLGAIGHWPWPRAIMAEMIGELDAAGAKVIGLDVVYFDQSMKRLEKRFDGAIVEVDDDALLAAAMKRSGRVILAGTRANGPKELGVLPLLADAAAGCGFVDHVPLDEGIVRQLPCVRRNANGKLQFSGDILIACAALGINPEMGSVSVEDNSLRLHPTGRADIIIPLTWTPQGEGSIQVPLFGTADWLTAYDVPAHHDYKQHLAFAQIYEAVIERRKIEANNRTAERAINVFKDLLDDAIGSAAPPDPSDRQAYQKRIAAVMKELEPFVGKPGAFADQSYADAASALQEIERTNRDLEKRLTQAQALARERVKDRIVMVGWLATGSIDFFPTSLHPACPGVVIRGMVIGGILTGELWRCAAWWINALVTLAMGMLMTWIATRIRSPIRMLGCAVIISTVYVFANGVIVFDWGNTIVNITGPLLAAMAVIIAALVLRTAPQNKIA